MPRLGKLKAKVDALYQEQHPERDSWADWLYEHHVMLVADKAGELARRFGADAELAATAGMLHDIADAEMSRFDTRHGMRSLEVARRFMEESGYLAEEIEIVVGDALPLHGCRDGQAPQTPEGKAMAAADAVVHLTTDFYEHADTAHKAEGMTDAESRAWTLKKLERDFHEKILFPEVRAEVKEIYEALEERFGAL